MKYEIKSRINGTVLFECEAGSLRLAVEAAVKAKANLRSADLRSADLRSADLRSADLRDADLRDADLRSADLRSANLSFANLSDADLRSADLSSADLSSADLRSANLSSANLSSVDLSSVPDVIRVPSLHRRIMAAIEAGGTLDMGTWHACETTHCRAGWAVHLAGPAGTVLEYCMGTPAAAALIHAVSCPELKGKVPDFYATNEEAMVEIKRLAALEPELEPEAKP